MRPAQLRRIHLGIQLSEIANMPPSMRPAQLRRIHIVNSCIRHWSHSEPFNEAGAIAPDTLQFIFGAWSMRSMGTLQ